MDTLNITKILEQSGFKREQAEAVAQVVDTKNNELMTKNDGKRLEWMIISIAIAGGAGFGYLVSLFNAIITKI